MALRFLLVAKNNVPYEALRPAAKTALYAILASNHPNYKTRKTCMLSDDPLPTRNIEVHQLVWVDDLAASLDEVDVRLLAHYTMESGGNMLPDRCSTSTALLNPFLIDALSKWCPCRREHASAVSAYYKSIGRDLLHAVRETYTETTRSIQRDLLWLAIEIEKQQDKDVLTTKFREVIFNQLPEGKRKDYDILDCLVHLLERGSLLEDFTEFFFTQTFLEAIGSLEQRLQQAAQAGG
ncbi:hypothetical protein BJX70DRAFT_380261 [Aspergillus crustosus]